MAPDSGSHSPWAELGLSPTRDIGAVRRAYADRLKAIDQATDQPRFQALRRAYEAALAYAAADTTEPAPSPAQAAPSSLDPVLGEFVALGERGKVAAAMALVERVTSVGARSLEQAAAIEARLFTAVMDDPLIPPALLAALARHFRWNEVGSALEQRRPELYERYLHRMGTAYAWLNQARELARQKDPIGATATALFLPYSARQRLGRVDTAALEVLVREARRFGPLLGDAIDPRMIDHLGQQQSVNDRPGFWRLYLALLRPYRLVLGLVAFVLFAGIFGPDWLQPYVPGGRGAKLDDDQTLLIKYPENWVSIKHNYLSPTLTAYFTGLMDKHSLIAGILYGVDKDVPDTPFDFPFSDSAHLSDPISSVPLTVEVPLTTRFLSVQVTFKDGATTDIHRYGAPATKP